MTTHAAGFSATWSNETGESATPSSTDTVETPSQLFLPVGSSFVAALGDGGSAFLDGLVGPSCGRAGSRSARDSSSVQMWHGYIFDGVTRFSAWTTGGNDWTISGTRFDNGGLRAISTNQRFPPLGPALVLEGGALAALGGAPVFADGVATIAYAAAGGYWGRSHFNEFIEDPPDSVLGAPVALNRIRQQLAQGGSQFSVGTQSDGKERVLNSCSFAGLDGAGWVWVRPEDLGNGVDQIPGFVAQNTAANFRFFPNAFFRRSSYVDGLQLAAVDDVPITSETPIPSQPFRIISIGFTPQNSSWLFIIDGQSVCVRVDHPSGSDLRRPDEIWNAVIVPAIQQNMGPQTSLSVANPSVFNILGPLNDRRGLVDKLKYLQFARMLKVNDNSGGFTVTDVPQGTP